MGGGKGGLYMGTYNPSDTKTDFCTFSRNVIVSDNPIETSEDFYKTISCGGKESQLSNGKGVQTVFEDGTRIVYRVITSTPDSPAVDITVNIESPVKKQKIHFIRKD